MDKQFYINEIISHFDYYYALDKEQNRISDKCAEIVKGLKALREKGEPLDKEKFIELGELQFKSECILTDMLKLDARLRLIYTYAFNEGINLDESLIGKYKASMSDFVKGMSAGEFSFVARAGNVDYVSDEMKSMVSQVIERRVNSMNLDEALDAYIEQFDNYINSLKNAEKADKK